MFPLLFTYNVESRTVFFKHAVLGWHRSRPPIFTPAAENQDLVSEPSPPHTTNGGLDAICSHSSHRCFHFCRVLFSLLHVAHFSEEVGSKDETVESLVVGIHHLVFRSLPSGMTFTDEEDVLADAHDGVHVVGVDDGGRLLLRRDVMNQIVIENGRLRVKT